MKITTHRELEVYKLSFVTALEIYHITKKFPLEERYSLTDQIRRSSRSVCANIAEGYRKRKYSKHFVSKLSDAESEAAETQTWLEFSLAHEYIDAELYDDLNDKYDHILAMLVKMSINPEKWAFHT